MYALKTELTAAGTATIKLPTEAYVYGVYAESSWSDLVLNVRDVSINVSKSSRAWTSPSRPFKVNAGISFDVTTTAANTIVVLYDTESN